MSSPYLILQLPSANRVYADAAPRLLRAELAIAGEALGGRISGISDVRLGGLSYTAFGLSEVADDSDDAVRLLSALSSVYGLFEQVGELLRPVPLRSPDRFDSDLLTIQKYPGKTNEQFTKLLVNLTCLATDDPLAMLRKPLRLLDPLCGRGTTLNQAMMYGFDAVGVELDGKDFDAYERFVKTWLRGKRLKHTADSGQLRQHKQRLGRKLDITYAGSKDDFKSGEVRTLAYRAMDTLRVDELLPAGSFDVIVADAPYGVQHGSHQGAALQRSPRDLLAAAVPVWTRVLRPGGAIGISWNTLVLPRAELLELLRRAGLEPREGGPYDEFAHRVDQAIERDLIVASRPT